MVTLRPATMEDEDQLLEWRNEPSTRAASLTTDEIAPAEHRRWLERKLADPNCAILIVEEDGQAVGQVRLDQVEPEVGEVSIGLAPDARGRGIGTKALTLAAGSARSRLGLKTLRALVRSDNLASISAFQGAGFAIRQSHGEILELGRSLG
jgi:RimJ/RimL family protein N-acetyltransferase